MSWWSGWSMWRSPSSGKLHSWSSGAASAQLPPAPRKTAPAVPASRRTKSLRVMFVTDVSPAPSLEDRRIDHFAAAARAERLPGRELDAVVDEVDGAVAEQHVDPGRVVAAGGEVAAVVRRVADAVGAFAVGREGVRVVAVRVP